MDELALSADRDHLLVWSPRGFLQLRGADGRDEPPMLLAAGDGAVSAPPARPRGQLRWLSPDLLLAAGSEGATLRRR
jgi:hypothetical protein